MQDKVLKKLLVGFIQVHILHHANQEPVYGSCMIEEIQRHGYLISAGTLYPLLHELHAQGLLTKEEHVVDGKRRKYYTLTTAGEEVLQEAREKAQELVDELVE